MEFCLAYLCLKSAMENPVSLRAGLAGLSENLKILSRHSAIFLSIQWCFRSYNSCAAAGFTGTSTSVGGQTISVSLTTANPYGPYARAVRRELRLDGIKVLRDGSDVTAGTVRVDLVSSKVESDTASIFINGSSKEYKMS